MLSVCKTYTFTHRKLYIWDVTVVFWQNKRKRISLLEKSKCNEKRKCAIC